MIGTPVDNLAALLVQRGIENRKLSEQRNHELDQQWNICQARATLFSLGLERFTQFGERTTIHIIESCGVWNSTPGTFHMLGNMFAQALQRLTFILSWCYRMFDLSYHRRWSLRNRLF